MKTRIAAFLLAPALTSCAMMTGLSASETECDPVTGQSVINRYTLKQEIEIGMAKEPKRINKEIQEGYAVDQDQDAVQRINRILKPITQVSHLPRLPWRAHFSSRPQWNANADLSGLIFVFKGLLDDVSDGELAAVLGHEVAHVTCRHITENESHRKLAGALSDSAHGAFYEASFSTEQEAEADRVGILYMALAGFDPGNAAKVWDRMHERQGSKPGNYLYTHPLNMDRANSTEKWGKMARQYFAGPGVVNPKSGEILANNKLVPRQNRPDDPNWAFLNAALSSYVTHKETKAEAQRREHAYDKKAEALKYLKVANVKYGNTRDGHRGVFADLTNGSNALMKSVDLEIRYLDGSNQVVHRESIRVSNVRSGETRNTGFYLKRVNYKNIFVAVIDADY